MTIGNLEPKLIGQVGVDSGLIWIGDPCYVIHEDNLPSTLGKDWPGFCDELGEEFTKAFDFPEGYEGLGICTATTYGDGVYNVIGLFKPGNKRPSCVVVDFDNVFDEED